MNRVLRAPMVLDSSLCAVESHRAARVSSTHRVTFPSCTDQSFHVCDPCAEKWRAKAFIVVELVSELWRAA
jgi:hypothetical protein